MATPNRVVVVHNGRRLLDETGVRVEIPEQDKATRPMTFLR